MCVLLLLLLVVVVVRRVCVCELGNGGCGGCMRVSLGRNAMLPSVCAPDNNVKSCILAKRGLAT